MRKILIRKNKDKKYVAAITTIELVLILVILIALLLIFKEQLISLITTSFEKVTSESSGISHAVRKRRNYCIFKFIIYFVTFIYLWNSRVCCDSRIKKSQQN